MIAFHSFWGCCYLFYSFVASSSSSFYCLHFIAVFCIFPFCFGMLLSFCFGMLLSFLFSCSYFFFPTLCMIGFCCGVLVIHFVLGVLLPFLFVHCFFFFLSFACLCMIAFCHSLCTLSFRHAFVFLIPQWVISFIQSKELCSVAFLYLGFLFWACCCLFYSSVVHFICPFNRIAFH